MGIERRASYQITPPLPGGADAFNFYTLIDWSVCTIFIRYNVCNYCFCADSANWHLHESVSTMAPLSGDIGTLHGATMAALGVW
jgi:hypothetical protein